MNGATPVSGDAKRLTKVVGVVLVAHVVGLWALFSAHMPNAQLLTPPKVLTAGLLVQEPAADKPDSAKSTPANRPADWSPAKTQPKPALPVDAARSKSEVLTSPNGDAVATAAPPQSSAITPPNPLQATQGQSTATSSPSPSQLGSTHSNMGGSGVGMADAAAGQKVGQQTGQQTVELPAVEARYLHNPPLDYPRISRMRGEQGRVLVNVLIGQDGSAQKVEIKTSSGFDRLDQAAMNSVQRWRFVPGKKGGVPQAMWFTVPVNFVLE